MLRQPKVPFFRLGDEELRQAKHLFLFAFYVKRRIRFPGQSVQTPCHIRHFHNLKNGLHG